MSRVAATAAHAEVRGQSRVSHKGREGCQESEEKLTIQGTSAPTNSDVRCRLDLRSPSGERNA